MIIPGRPPCDDCGAADVVYCDRLWAIYLCRFCYDDSKREDGTIDHLARRPDGPPEPTA